jgi:hypothetical protein
MNLKSLIDKVKWIAYERQTDMPHPQEVKSLGAWDDMCIHIESSRLESVRSGKRYVRMAALYSIGLSLEEIAEHENVTRERVKQCIAKYVRQKKNGEKICPI